ncbi:MAG: hypothetical protein ACTSWP_12160 [Candidatus Freyarchaeota archaeon]|nr:hypothetical protein [Candidatus Freyrarchaeum guaymaensis]
MEVKGWSYYYPVSGKINLEAYLSITQALIDYLLEKEGDVSAAIREGWNVGRRAGARFLVRYSDKIRKHGGDLHGLAKIFDTMYESLSSKKFDKIRVSPEEGLIIFEDYNCPLCKGFILPEEFREEGRACIQVDGLFTEICRLIGFNAESWETKCRAAGHECCRHELKITR